MGFAVRADAYDRFMGRYSAPLAGVFADFAGVAQGQRALDVGCGPGALTGELVRRLGAPAVCAVDPSKSFVATAQQRHGGVAVVRAAAEHLPFRTRSFDVSSAQLVVHFMADPVAGLGEMARVTRVHGVVAACVWDHQGGRGPLSPFWEAVRDLDSGAEGEDRMAGARQGHLPQLFGAAGLAQIKETSLSITVTHESFEEWWHPYTLGVGPAGLYAAGLDRAQQDRLREQCRRTLPTPPFLLTAHAWAARGLVPAAA